VTTRTPSTLCPAPGGSSGTKRARTCSLRRYSGGRSGAGFAATPRGENDYLLRGTIWVNAEDFAVQRIEGEPAKRHSILIKRVHFVHEFAKFGEFWFPVHHRSETELRLFGKATLEIDYSGYQWDVRHPSRESERAVASRIAAPEANSEYQGGKQ